MIEKELLVKLFNDKDGKFYIQIGKKVFKVPESVINSLKEKEGLEIVYVNSLNDVR